LTPQEKAEVLVRRGIELSRAGRRVKAMDCFREALSLVPGDPVISYDLALEYMFREEWEAALDCLECSVEGEPENGDYWVERGIALFHAGDCVRAEESLEQAMACGADTSRLWNSLGVLRFVTRRYDEAETFFTRAVELDPQNPDAWFNLADTLEVLGNRKGARDARRRFEKLEGGGPS